MNARRIFMYTQSNIFYPDYQSVVIEKHPRGFFRTFHPEFYTTYLIEKKRQ